MATALAVYVTNQFLTGHVAATYGFVVTEHGVGVATFTVETRGAAFGVSDHTDVAVLELLLATNHRAVNGVLYDSDDAALMKSRRNMANEVDSLMNQIH